MGVDGLMGLSSWLRAGSESRNKIRAYLFVFLNGYIQYQRIYLLAFNSEQMNICGGLGTDVSLKRGLF